MPIFHLCMCCTCLIQYSTGRGVGLAQEVEQLSTASSIPSKCASSIPSNPNCSWRAGWRLAWLTLPCSVPVDVWCKSLWIKVSAKCPNCIKAQCVCSHQWKSYSENRYKMIQWNNTHSFLHFLLFFFTLFLLFRCYYFWGEKKPYSFNAQPILAWFHGFKWLIIL